MTTPVASTLPPLTQLDIKHQNAMKHLINTVILTFYEPAHYILVDILMKHHILRDDDLAGRVGLNVKELTKVMVHLTGHRLVQAYRQNEMKENQGRIVGKQYYWIDLQRFCNVVKWRIADMRNQIENSLKAELDNKGYICPRCTKSFTALEVDQVFDPMRNVLACDVCNTELEDNEHSEKVQGSKDRMQRFNAQMKYIRDALKDIEGVVVPAFDVVRYVREQMAAQKAMGMLDEDGLKIATGSARVAEVEIQMVEDEDEDEKKRERQKNAEEKRKQNAMPTWHTNSTISGEKTALGIQAEERSNNDALLAALDAQAKAAQEKAAGFDTFDTENYYDKLINNEEDSPRGTKRKLEEGEDDPRHAKMPRKDGDGAGHWMPGGYPPMHGYPYGYPPHMFPPGQRGGPPGGYPVPGYPHPGGYPPMPGFYGTPGSSQSQRATQSAGTSGKTTPSQQSDSDSSQDTVDKGPTNRGSNGAAELSEQMAVTVSSPHLELTFPNGNDGAIVKLPVFSAKDSIGGTVSINPASYPNASNAKLIVSLEGAMYWTAPRPPDFRPATVSKRRTRDRDNLSTLSLPATVERKHVFLYSSLNLPLVNEDDPASPAGLGGGLAAGMMGASIDAIMLNKQQALAA
ncbi:hypothetical protein FRC17_009782, partial [Serendipita sp. 399]